MILVDYTKIDTYLEEHIPALLEDLSRLVAIDSERTSSDPRISRTFFLRGMPSSLMARMA